MFGRRVTIALLLMSMAACGQAPAAAPAPRAGNGTSDAGMTFQQFESRRAARFLALDTDGDGRISRAEFIAGQASGKGDPERRFTQLDGNGDGFVDRGEIDVMLKRRFARFDADHDGRITQAERAATHKDRAQPEDKS